jgi:[protein-PII] uridylyltransferase
LKSDSAIHPTSTGHWDAWFNLPALDAGLAQSGRPLALFRQFLSQSRATLKQKFEHGVGASVLIKAHSWLVDQLLVRAWRRFLGEDAQNAALVAVGGYGRTELMPGSDIDLLVLLPDTAHEPLNPKLESLLVFLWDIGLEVGQSVRTVGECVEQSLADVTVVTNLMEARLLVGNMELYGKMQAGIVPEKIWNSREFFETKRREQKNRHRKYHDTAYKLEPNVKESPGGLRDIQMICWVANRHFGTTSLEGLVTHGFLTKAEYDVLVEGRNLLWEIRFALHILTGRGEDRLLFDHQRSIAGQFGYHDEGDRLGVEVFMKRYYRTVMDLNRLNEMLLQLFQEEILFADRPAEIVPLNRRFQSRNGFIEITDGSVFANYPFALLEIFLLLEQNPRLKGIRADTIRAIRAHRHLIDEGFRADIRSRSLFMEILRQPYGVTHGLRTMNTYGVLAAYLPAFGRIVGLMQYDLFHIYTVDEHILFVVRNLRRFMVAHHADEFPLCSHIIATLPKPELLYLAGLFHDIAKGRTGDHSQLGSAEAREFCVAHHLSGYDTDLVEWLVARHLLMSFTAQREDISDPAVINRFAGIVGDPVRLDYLYVLTVADIRATNPELWTTWKDALLRQLYFNTRRAFQRGLKDPLERSEHIQQVQSEARRLLSSTAVDAGRRDAIWEMLGEEYFLRHTSDQVVWHTRLIEKGAASGECIVAIHPSTERGSTEIFIYACVVDELFTMITAVLERLGLNVVDAGIITTNDGHVLNTFHVLETSGQPVENERRAEEIRAALVEETASGERRDWHVSRRTPRRYLHFPIKTHIAFKPDELDHRTVLELITPDHPGLLSQVGRAFTECGVRLLNAKIATLGSRAEDVFYITDRNNAPLEDAGQRECLERSLRKHLGADTEAGTPADGNRSQTPFSH